MFAKLVGEGYERPNAEDDLPLDVNYAKIAEWLVDRKLVQQDWIRRLQTIQATAAQAVKQLPPGFLGQFDGGADAPLDYFLATQILAKLTETAERGLLGSLKGDAGTWQRVVKAYDSNFLHMAEAGMTLARNVDYEVPYYRKQAAKHQQTLLDLERRRTDALKSAAAAAAEFRQECVDLGLQERAASGGPSQLRAALLDLTSELPQLMSAAVRTTRAEAVGQAAEYYAAFVAMGSACGDITAARDQVAVLAEVREGRTQAPLHTLDNTSLEATSAEGPQVDWDVGGQGEGDPLAEASNGIAWELDEAGAGDAGISWDVDIDVLVEEEQPAVDTSEADSGAAVEISWDIDMSGLGEDTTAAGETVPAIEHAPATPDVGAPAHVPGSDASVEVQRLCADAEYRSALLDDLHELRAFLRQRAAELTARGMDVMPADAPEAVTAVGAEGASARLDAVDVAIAALTGERLVRLLSLAGSSRYRERLLAALARRAGQEGKMKCAANEADARAAEVQRHLVSDSARLGALVRRTREVKTAVEAALGSRLGRRVNVQGEINAVLTQQH